MKNILSFVFVFAAAAAIAEPAITRQAVRQRWPFSNKVDIDLYLESDANSDVELTATWNGQATPVPLTVDQLEGSTNLRPGFNHLVWDPLAAGLGESKLTGFTVTAALASFDSRKYLVLDLINRNWAYYADDPDGKRWNDDKYKRHYMVFRRVPAGVYQLGLTTAQMDHLKDLGANQNYRTGYDRALKARTVTITKDYYIGIYQVTGGQRQHIAYYGTLGSGKYYNGGTYCNEITSSGRKYVGWRCNSSDATLTYAWPQDGHDVAEPEMTKDPSSGLWVGESGSGSVIGQLRALMRVGGSDLPSNMVIDLPTQEQWEIAARAGTTTLLADFGTLESTKEEIFAYQDVHSVAGSNPGVGLKEPNSWNLYDTAGLNYEALLNTVTATDASAVRVEPVVTFDESQTVDPVGLDGEKGESLFGVAGNCGWTPQSINYLAFPPNRRAVNPLTGDNVSARLCIHLK